jgi:hypothetical protein
VAGFGAAIWTTSRTIRAARDDKLWEKKAASYKDAVSFLLQRNQRRKVLTQRHPVTEAEFASVNEPFGDIESPARVFALESRLHAFAPEHVVLAFKNAVAADNDAGYRYLAWIRASSAEAVAAAETAFNEASQLAQIRDNASLEAIRGDLGVDRAPGVPAGQILPPDPIPRG